MRRITSAITCFLLLLSQNIHAQRTVGLVKYKPQNQKGYMLFSPMNSKNAYLMDKCGKIVHQWSTPYFPGLSLSLFPDGSLLRTGTQINTNFGLGVGGFLQKYSWDGNLLWEYKISDTNQALHHDVCIMPNGNLLAIIWEKKSIADCIAKGRNPSNTTHPLWSERIIEIQPIGKDSMDIVWEWKAWDHMIQDFDNKKPNYGVVKDHPELFDINYFETSNNGQDWFHLNSISYNPTLDQIILTAHSLCEIYIIDHSTNLLQATGHTGGNMKKGGDVLYRWGNPQAYGRGAESDRKLFKPHHANWIPNEHADGGAIMIYNNGWDRPEGNYSTVDVVTPPKDVNGNYIISNPLAFGPSSAKEVYKAPKPTDFYSQIISGAYSLPNGGLFVTCGTQGRIFETDDKDSIIWQYINPITSGGILNQGQKPNNNNSVFRAEFYPQTHPAFSGKTLTPSVEIEKNPISQTLCEVGSTEVNSSYEIKISPMPFKDILHLENIYAGKISVLDMSGKYLYSESFSSDINLAFLTPGIYLLQIESDKGIAVFKIQKTDN